FCNTQYALAHPRLQKLEAAQAEQQRLYNQASEYYNRMTEMQSELDRANQEAEQCRAENATLRQSLDNLLAKLGSDDAAAAANDNDDDEEGADEGDGEGQSEDEEDDDEDQRDAPDGGENGAGDDDDAADSDSASTRCRRRRRLQKRRQRRQEIQLQRQEQRADLIRRLLDAEAARRELEELRSRQEQFESHARAEAASRLELENELSAVRAEQATLREDRDKACTELKVLRDYFKDRECEWQRRLGQQELTRQSDASATASAQQRLDEQRAEIDQLRARLEATQSELAEAERVHRRRIGDLEKRAHDSWLAAKAAERQLSEVKDDNSALRAKLTALGSRPPPAPMFSIGRPSSRSSVGSDR
uniref:DUF4515 domain-containing protein n=1 Tax=Macrostomum lignano TaxID=282301 RepID=A0A1I8HQN5_9PLAT